MHRVSRPTRLARARIVTMIAAVVTLCSLDLAAGAEGKPVALPASIDATGQTDVTEALQGFLAGVPDGTTVALPARGRFRIEGTITLRGARRLAVEGNDSTLFATTTGGSHRAHLQFVGGAGVTVRNLTVVGSNERGGTRDAFVDDLQYQHGIDLRGVAGAVLERVRVEHVYGDCFYIGQGIDHTRAWSTDVQIRGSGCANNGRQGVAVTAGRDVLVQGNHLAGIGLMPFNVEPNGTGDGADWVTITGNTVERSRQWFVGVVGEGPVSNVTVAENRLRGRSMSMLLQLEGTKRITNVFVEGNVSDTGERYNPSGAVIDAHRVDGLTVQGNHQPPADPRTVFVRTWASCRVAVSGNAFPDALELLADGASCSDDLRRPGEPKAGSDTASDFFRELVRRTLRPWSSPWDRLQFNPMDVSSRLPFGRW